MVPALCDEPRPVAESTALLLRELQDLALGLQRDQERLVLRYAAQLASGEAVAAGRVSCLSSIASDEEHRVPSPNQMVMAGARSSMPRNVTPGPPDMAAISEEIQCQFVGKLDEFVETHSDLGEVSQLHFNNPVSSVLAPAYSSQSSVLPWVARRVQPNWRGVRRWLKWWYAVEEPERTGCLARLVRSSACELMTLAVICLNGLLVVHQTDSNARRAYAGESLHERGWEVAEAFFVAYFLLELSLKLAVHRAYFFCNSDACWNCFDVFAIAASVVDAAVTLADVSGENLDVVFLRTLRVLRLAKNLRVVRALHFVRSLRQLVNCIISSLWGLFWCMVLLVFITGIFAVFLVQCTTIYWLDEPVAQDERAAQHIESIPKTFRDVQTAMFHLFKATSGGADWGDYYDMLSVTGALGPTILILYVLFFMIAAWNIVTSLFVERALALAQPDIETQMLLKKHQDMKDAKDLMRLIKTIDDDKSGTISIQEFNKWMREPSLQRFFKVKDIDIKDAELFFHMLEAATQSDEIQLSIVVNGLMRMRGIATNLDLHALNFTINNVHLTFDRQMKRVMAELRQLSRQLLRLRGGAESPGGSGRRPPTSI